MNDNKKSVLTLIFGFHALAYISLKCLNMVLCIYVLAVDIRPTASVAGTHGNAE